MRKLSIVCFLENVRPRVKLCLVKFLLLSVLWLWLMVPGVVSAQVVDIPDPNLRAAIAAKLDKAPDDAITRAEMETLDSLSAKYRDITDLRGIEFAINLTELILGENSISDISPLATLTNLTKLGLGYNSISDISAVSNLTNLQTLGLRSNSISDISPVSTLTNLTKLVLSDNTILDISSLANLTNLTSLNLWGTTILDISSLANLTNLTFLGLGGNSISDIASLANLTNLTFLNLWDNSISDIASLANLTNLTFLNLWDNSISDIASLANLTNLTFLNLGGNSISDIASLANLTNLTRLDLRENQITNVSPLVGLVNLEWLWLRDNPIEDLSPLATLFEQNPSVNIDIYPPMDKITGPWLWMIAPTEPGRGGRDSTDVDSLAAASGWAVTEAAIAKNGANIGDRVGNYVWTPAVIADTGRNNVNDVVNSIGFAQGDVNDHSSYALISLASTTDQSDVVMKVGSDDSIKVWLNGQVVYTNAINRGASDFQDLFRVNLVEGNNLLLVKVSEGWSAWSMFVGIDADFTVVPPPAPVLEPLLDVNSDGQVNVIDLMWVAISYGMRGEGLSADVNRDGVVNIQDFAAVAAGVDVADFLPQAAEQVLLAALEQAVELEAVAEAPMAFKMPQHAFSNGLVYGNVAAALADARLLAETGTARLHKGVALLETLLALLTEMRAIPKMTALLPNYPNPFNPETWIPYQLQKAADVQISIYDQRGVLVRQLSLGHQVAGQYLSRSRAAYWDGKNEIGESVASGLYFYTFTAGDFSATRRMLILK